jgi:hypothetical protein
MNYWKPYMKTEEMKKKRKRIIIDSVKQCGAQV